MTSSFDSDSCGLIRIIDFLLLLEVSVLEELFGIPGTESVFLGCWDKPETTVFDTVFGVDICCIEVVAIFVRWTTKRG